MSRVRLLFSEAWSSIRQNISTTFAATMTVLIGMFILGLFIALGSWGLSYGNHVQKELQVKVYFAQTATQAQEVAVGNRLRADHRVKKVVYVSKAQALEAFIAGEHGGDFGAFLWRYVADHDLMFDMDQAWRPLSK